MKKKNIIVRFITNIYVKNLLLMGIILVALVCIVLFALNSYTKHNESIAVPSVKGLQMEEAFGIFKSSGLNYEIIDSVFQTGGTPGAVLDQIPKAESKVKKGRSIYLVVQAKGHQVIAMPSLQDYSRRQAEAQLNALGFNKIIIKEVPSAYRDIVISVLYQGKEITAGQKIPKGATLQMTVGAGGEEPEDSTSTENKESTNMDKSFF